MLDNQILRILILKSVDELMLGYFLTCKFLYSYNMLIEQKPPIVKFMDLCVIYVLPRKVCYPIKNILNKNLHVRTVRSNAFLIYPICISFSFRLILPSLTIFS